MSCRKNFRARGASEIWGRLGKVSGYLQDDAIDRSMYYYLLLHRFNEAFLITLFQRIFRHNDDVYHDYTKSAKKKEYRTCSKKNFRGNEIYCMGM